MAFTSHGHHIPGTVLGPERPVEVARCGGPGLCKTCSRQANIQPLTAPEQITGSSFESGTPTFQQELCALINKHSMENYSGTPDWILTEFLMGCLRSFDVGVKLRSEWRGEDVNLPALQRRHEGQQEIPDEDAAYHA